MLGTICVSAVLLAIVSSIIYSMVKSSRSGKKTCGCNCASCGGKCRK